MMYLVTRKEGGAWEPVELTNEELKMALLTNGAPRPGLLLAAIQLWMGDIQDHQFVIIYDFVLARKYPIALFRRLHAGGEDMAVHASRTPASMTFRQELVYSKPPLVFDKE
jgi:hypothetical protein